MPSDDSFLVLDVNEADESLFAVGRCPHELHLGAIALDDSGRLHALCLEFPGTREPLIVHGIYDQQTSAFSWDVPFPVTSLDLSFDWVALGLEGGLPLVMIGNYNLATLFFMRPSSSTRTVEWLYGAFTSARDILVIHARQGVERPGYFRMRVNQAGPSRDSPLAFSATAGTLLPSDTGVPFGPNEPPVLAVEHSGQLLLPLPKLEPFGFPAKEGSPGFVLPLLGVTPIGGVRSAGGGVFVHSADRGLVFDCGGGKRITLSHSDTRLSRASCTEARCVVVYFEPFQPAEVDSWSRDSFHVRRIQRATCTD